MDLGEHEDSSEGDFNQKKKAKKGTGINTPLAQKTVCLDSSWMLTATKRRCARHSALFYLNRQKVFVNVLTEIRYEINPQDNGAKVSSIRKTKGRGGPFELCPKRANIGTFCKATKGLL